MKLPRILFAAGASGSGKTLVTCAFLQALRNRGLQPASFKCGPDYIDPMFHSRVLGTKSRNLDTFFTSPSVTRYLLGTNAADCDLAVMEGVMGFYDGVAGIRDQASAWDLADVTDTPVIFVVNSRGMSRSLCAYLKGFLEYKKDSHIAGVIFNRMSGMLYPRMKKLVEEELGIRALGYVPEAADCQIESRHLGLVLPDEILELQEKLLRLSHILEETLELDEILALASRAPKLSVPKEEELDFQSPKPRQMAEAFSWRSPEPLRIGVAKDEAFCFFYEDNFRLLQKMGAELVYFSPLHQKRLPEKLDGLLLYGGYPELFAKELSENASMRECVKKALDGGMPCMAECGGFMYLHRELEDMNGESHPMVGVLSGRAYRTPKLGRFGYITLESQAAPESLGPIPAHEFHYFESTSCGSAFYAQKPESQRGWECVHDDGSLFAGFPHLYYYGNPCVPRQFLNRCLAYKKERP